MIFKHWNYKDYLKEYMAALPKKGRGFAKELADHLNVGPVIISQTLNGERELSLENAFKVSEFLSHSKLEQRYFVKLVEYQRAGHHGLKQLYREELLRLRQEVQKVAGRYQKHSELSEQDKFTFYSDRLYSAVRMASSLPEIKNYLDVAKRFGIEEKRAQEITEFLLANKLCVMKEGKLAMGPQHTFVPANSPYVISHHRNWRIYSMQKSSHLDHECELMFTAPLSLSKEVFSELKRDILDLIDSSLKKVSPSQEEMVACLNIDLLKI